MQRQVEPELLDELPPENPRAVASRRDLERLNWLMGNPVTVAEILRAEFDGKSPRRLIDLGCGDGRFMLQVAHRLAAASLAGVSLGLLDRVNSVEATTLGAYRALGCEVSLLSVDLGEGLGAAPPINCDAMVANLFLHHFSDARLVRMFEWVQRCTNVFIAVEPVRSGWALSLSKMVGLIGCGDVTRHDAPTSVRAGFTRDELARLWPVAAGWSVKEREHGWFRHVFVAKRDGPIYWA